MEIFLGIINVIGIVSFAAAGAMVAIDKETDLFGVIFLAVTTCFGGGFMRDVIVGDGLPAFFGMHLELAVSVSTALVVFLAAKLFRNEYVAEVQTVNRINNVLDALGLGVFAASGTAIYIHLGPLVAIIMGMLSSVGGSLIRDVILRDIPFILRKRIYAVAVLAGSSLYYVISEILMKGIESADVVATLACMATILSIRMCATHFKWNLPKAIVFSEQTKEKKEASAVASSVTDNSKQGK